jgi:hypothetical protein
MSSITSPPFHTFSATPIVLPPPYTEDPHDNLAAQLEQMKAMMEQMRLEKVRLEMDAKRKVEEEAVRETKRKEEEAAAKEANEIKALYEELHADFMKEWHEKGLSAIVQSQRSQGFDAYYTIDEKTRRPIVKRNGGLSPEGIRLAENYIQDGEKKLPMVTSFIKENILFGCKSIHHWITTKSLYITPKGLFIYDLTTNLWCPMYLFNKQLCAKDIHILRQLQDLYTISYSGYWNQGHPMALSNVEAVIRLIPGGYKNGSWRQLNGIFGMYYNEETNELSRFPPPTL